MMTTSRVLALALACASSLSIARAQNAAPRLDLDGYKLVFSDDFDKLDISRNGGNGTWAAHTPWNGDFGDARFADPAPRGPFSVDKGILSITARKVGDHWDSGLISSVGEGGKLFAARYGYFEMRAKLPAGKGLWPAFWLNASQPKNSKEPGIEVDILEHYGHFPDSYQALVHIWPKPTQGVPFWKEVVQVPAGSLYSDFHTYGADVEPDFITVYLDRKEVWRTRTPPEHHSDLMILANLAMGSGWPIDETPDPSVMQIDYIRVYQRK